MNHIKQAGLPNEEQQARYDELTSMMAVVKKKTSHLPLTFSHFAINMNQAAACVSRKNFELADQKIEQVKQWMELLVDEV